MSQPRIFSLQKLVEVADFNMDSRGRIVWANVWGVLSQHFSALGAHSNRYVRQMIHACMIETDVDMDLGVPHCSGRLVSSGMGLYADGEAGVASTPAF